MFTVQRLAVGSLGANCYIVAVKNSRDALVVDPGGDAKKIADIATENNLTIKFIVNTHGHIDHIAGNDELREMTGAPLLIHKLDAEMLTNPNLNLSRFMGSAQRFKTADKLLSDGDEIEIAGNRLKILHTPGHTKGGICIVGEGLVFTGDTLFNRSVGRSDFPGGDPETLIDSIKSKLLVLPDDTVVYPGHMEETTIGNERNFNMHLK